MSNAHGADFNGRSRRVAAAMDGRSAALDDAIAAGSSRVDGIDARLTALELMPATGGVVRTVIQLTAAQVASLGPTAGPSKIELAPLLPAGSSIINATTHLVTPFVSSVPLYGLNADLLWRANDSVPPDAVPLDMLPVKAIYVIGSDTAALTTWEGFGATTAGSPFDAETTSDRWPYTPTLVAKLTATGAGTPNLDSFTDGLLEIVVLSVTML